MKVSKVQIRKLVESIPIARVGWNDYANCAGKDVEEFIYPSEMPSRKVRRKLELLCSDCEVIITCRKEGLRLMEQGWWGGMDEPTRYEWAMQELFSQEEAS